MLDNKYYTYRHIRPDTGEVFYIGLGSRKRAWSKFSRSRFWESIVKKNEGKFTVEIITKDLLFEDALLHEVYLIELYGRRDLGHGTLCNLSNGGEGSPGTKPSEETRKKMSIKQKARKRTDQELCREKARKMTDNNRGKKQKPLSIERRVKKICKPILNIDTGEIYLSVLQAQKSLSITHNLINKLLKGKKNRSNLRLMYYKGVENEL